MTFEHWFLVDHHKQDIHIEERLLDVGMVTSNELLQLTATYVKEKEGSHKITDFFKKKKAVGDDNSDNNGVLETPSPLKMIIQEAYDRLTHVVAPIMNTKNDDKRSMRDYELRKHIGVHIYFGEPLKKTNNESFTNSRKHVKRASLLSNEDIKEAAQKWIITTKPEKRGIPELLKYLNHTVIPNMFNLPGNISASVLWNYMVEWGYSYRASKKTVYYNGHERADVVQYRKEWTPKMVEYSQFMENYDYPGREYLLQQRIVNQPLATGQLKPGGSIMDDAIPLFEKLHPGCQALFLLDQSSNHNAYEPSAKRNEDKKNERHTWFRKGLETILMERGLGKWDEYKAQGKYWKAKCGNKEANSDHTCCPYHMLENQPDFRAQKTALEELVLKSGHLYTLYPKYHCETNWIERYWSATKRIARRECDYSFESFSENLDGFLDQVSSPNATLIEIRRYYNRCWRYIYAYNDMKDGNEAFKIVEKFTSKRFLSHRKPGVHD
ncbi:hypothetical protein INT45_009431 [Circinella minor]|uniref:Uncharacterized protein n=1 Tax=Circinella minor TaxID=1195481 RepID=A0A8H7S2K6_9FUNG|nr:hypothetical protein INT45_009431 [Circinella minor]